MKKTIIAAVVCAAACLLSGCGEILEKEMGIISVSSDVREPSYVSESVFRAYSAPDESSERENLIEVPEKCKEDFVQESILGTE